MTQEQTLGFIRHFLTLIGGVFVTKGVIEETVMLEVVGAIVTLGAFIWSFRAKKA
jgi:hypothetical protein